MGTLSPSATGIRFFINQLLTMTQPPWKVVQRLQVGFRGDITSDALRTATEIISQLTRQVGFVTIPSRQPPIVRKLRFVKLSSSPVLAVIVDADGDIVNRIFTYDRVVSDSELNIAAAVYNDNFSGMTFDRAKSLLQGQLLALREQISSLLQALLDHVAIDDKADDGESQVAGKNNLLKQEGPSADIKKLRRLYDLLARKKICWH